MYMCICMYTYVITYIYIYMCIYVYVYSYIYIYIYAGCISGCLAKWEAETSGVQSTGLTRQAGNPKPHLNKISPGIPSITHYHSVE